MIPAYRHSQTNAEAIQAVENPRQGRLWMSAAVQQGHEQNAAGADTSKTAHTL
jgi:hypothetical protein